MNIVNFETTCYLEMLKAKREIEMNYQNDQIRINLGSFRCTYIKSNNDHIIVIGSFNFPSYLACRDKIENTNFVLVYYKISIFQIGSKTQFHGQNKTVTKVKFNTKT